MRKTNKGKTSPPYNYTTVNNNNANLLTFSEKIYTQ